MFTDNREYYGRYSGKFVPETLIPVLKHTEKAQYHEKLMKDLQALMDSIKQSARQEV